MRFFWSVFHPRESAVGFFAPDVGDYVILSVAALLLLQPFFPMSDFDFLGVSVPPW